MKISSGIYFRRKFAVSFLLLGAAVGFFFLLNGKPKASDSSPASVIGVHHLGPNYLINRFYINKSIGDNVGEEGGGGSQVCCIELPNKSTRKLTADVRWRVHRIMRSPDPASPETEVLEGVYQAQVPVEPYVEPGDFYVHFFPGGRVRIVVSSYTSDGKLHPIRSDDTQAIQGATRGHAVDAIFSKQDLVELQREIDRDREKYGDWR